MYCHPSYCEVAVHHGSDFVCSHIRPAEQIFSYTVLKHLRAMYIHPLEQIGDSSGLGSDRRAFVAANWFYS